MFCKNHMRKIEGTTTTVELNTGKIIDRKIVLVPKIGYCIITEEKWKDKGQEKSNITRSVQLHKGCETSFNTALQDGTILNMLQ
ncbi:Hypothetical protein ORPV_279 [Orpheovirus IHUMI-LCC2]|uniref:Uncharacterized protein n=1 Tax=Orpheovirus IHUMI-LCC2 TaxID=2023057 RepID=A0A2I2L3T0_9VIRU|nr:Hypothetical protein ORPV_279 [Orpheovirus IHUMI-LCC2]SNW62183.1 Hypothetical protein ORPV_279 [Orpheovirus IHUMI-LCC2]